VTHQRTTQCAAICFSVLSLIGAGLLINPINQQRQYLQIATGKDDAGAVPPTVAVMMAALGPFRALGVDFLWYRANRLQAQGQYFEANQLSQWITALQPRFPDVWAFHAWNMAYNISVATYTPQERWDWVNKGISLLRDKAIAYNPTAPKLYHQLGWIFFHKIGADADDMHWYYKQRLAMDWQQLLGATASGTTTDQVIQQFRLIVNAPDTPQQLAQQHPQTTTLIANLNALGYALDESLLRQISRVFMAQFSADLAVLSPQNLPPGNQLFDPQLAQVLADAQTDDSVTPLIAYLRKHVLSTRYHMDPGFMLHLMEQYGPIDWRHPAAHGCYWSEMGVKMSGPWSPQQHVDLLNTNRQALHTLQQLARRGQIVLDPVTGRLDMLPDVRFIPAYDKAMDNIKAKIQRGELGERLTPTSFEDGHENFLLRAMKDHYLYGNPEQARYFFNKARDLYAHKPKNQRSGRYRQTLPTLVTTELKEDFPDITGTRQLLVALIGAALNQGLSNNRTDIFDRFVQQAKLVHQRYQQDKLLTPIAPQQRMGLLPFDQVLIDTYISLMRSPSVSLLKRSRIWANTPAQIIQRVYPRLYPIFNEQCNSAGLNVDRAFPKPPPRRPSIDRSQPTTQPSQQPTQIQRQ